MRPVESDISAAYLRGSSWGATYGPIAADFPQTNLREACCDPWPTCGYNPRCASAQPRSTGEPACTVPWPNLTGVDPPLKRGRGHRPPRQRDGANPTAHMRRDMRRSHEGHNAFPLYDNRDRQALLTQINYVQEEDDEDTFFDFWSWEILHLRQ